ncbi:ABC transporter ATP-binding protein [Taibaiella soli]|uniref:ABC transporter ATP-binding protein n=1 Tax=Taibaiella soli TaxID=1649169 RepID=A0A2W2AE17_9BACT|nr:ABC transporter ATP-binding protein [Taibaiella soli]PZF71792.1 ABC transporter ATP-binding protein [Taibaiella soli]
MSYDLNHISGQQQKTSNYAALKGLLKLIAHERPTLLKASAAILLNSGLNLCGPFLIGYTIDHYVQHKDYHGVLLFSGILLGMYLTALFTSYFQTNLMGGVGQRLLFTLRNTIFEKLQVLPMAFFNSNKAGDLISRVNNDTDKLNTFFSQSLTQFIGSIVTMTGAGIFLLATNPKLGAATLLPALLILIFTKVVSPWVKKKNAVNLKSVGGMSAEIQESLSNFRVIIAFNRRDYFRQRFDAVNRENYRTAVGAGLANNVFLPVYSFFSGMAQLIVLCLGIYLISIHEFTVGLLVSFLAYVVNFYNPLRQLAALWTNFQVAMAGWDRISQILAMDNNMPAIEQQPEVNAAPVLEFRNVHFGYVKDKEILHDISLQLESGKTYAFVGPTGGGKSTTASLIARLYDPTDGEVLLNGRDIRSFTPEERAGKIGFILQEPFLFSGTVKDNILYGNPQYQHFSNEQLEAVIQQNNLGTLLKIFDQGLDTKVSSGGDSISLGQKQLIAFMRAVLRNPEILILDEATANIDTVTERLLEDILDKLPPTTTRMIIAHRLNTIENADEIFFVNAGEVTRAGSFEDALDKLLSGKRTS